MMASGRAFCFFVSLSLLVCMPAPAQWDAAETESAGETSGTATVEEPGRLPGPGEPERGNPAFPPRSDASYQTTGGPVETDEDLAPPTILHEPVKHAVRDSGFWITANLLDLSGVASANVFYRHADASSFEVLAMRKGLDGIYKAFLPAQATRTEKIVYYLEATDLKANGPARLGSPEQPLEVFIDRPQAGKKGISLEAVGFALLAVSLFVGVLLWMVVIDKRRQARVQDAKFWTRKLLPLLNLPGIDASRRLTIMSRTPMFHPVYGMQLFPRIVLLRKLQHLKKLTANMAAEPSGDYDKVLKQELVKQGAFDADRKAPSAQRERDLGSRSEEGETKPAPNKQRPRHSIVSRPGRDGQTR